MANDNRRPQLSEVLMQIAAVDPLVALDVSALQEFLLREGAAATNDRQPAPGKIAVVPIQGPLSARTIRGWSGSYPGMDSMRSQIRQYANDPDIGAIVLDIDSPGGTVAGTMETAAEIKAAASQKPVIAIANTLAASAAYWIASQASEFVMAPSADVGSIGTMVMHQDVSGLLDQLGVKITMIRSEQSPLKNEAHPFAPLSEDAGKFLQARANDAGAEFIKAVAAGRRVSQAKVREDFGQGRVYGAREALSRGMVDRIATFDDVIAGLASKMASPRMRRRSALAFE